jgi:MFS family permease
MISQATPMLLLIQVMAGVSWATYELAAFLLFFEAIDARERIGMLTLYNLGYAAATVAGSFVGGGILALFGESHTGYLAVFAASGLARGLTVPLLRRVRDSVAAPAHHARPATIPYPPESGEERPLSRAA